MNTDDLTPKRKALAINLDSTVFGTIAEIGGGQEVAGYFFHAGGASGTIAKTISAYDKNFSDHLYNNNQPGIYVSEDRLIKMLDKEYNEVTNLLAESKGDSIRFFAFANTVSTLNFKKDNISHGWFGVKYQLSPNSKPNEIIIHIRLLENDGILQQNTLGILGVNLIYACFYLTNNTNVFIRSLIDNLSTDRVEINMIRMQGPDLAHIDNRLLAVQLVKNGMTNVTMFDKKGHVLQPSDKLYKKDVLVIRSSFRPITCVGFDMIKTGFANFRKDTTLTKKNTVILCEITTSNLLGEGEFNEKDYLDRVDLLNAMGQDVMISNFKEFYLLAGYFSQFKINNLRLIVSAYVLKRIMNPENYTHLRGGILEAFGMLFLNNMKLFVYPAIDDNTGGIMTVKNTKINDELNFLFQHLLESQKIIGVETIKTDNLWVYPHIVRSKIQNNEPGWEKLVLRNVADFIKEKKLFGYLDNKC